MAGERHGAEATSKECGSGGLEYNPIIYLPMLGKTTVELSMNKKKRLSHRAQAVMKAREILRKLFSK